MSYTNAQAKELLNERFTNSQITEAFEEMARRGVKISLKDAQFEDEVIHTLVAILEAGDRAIKEQKSLPQAPSDAETFVGGAIQRAQSELSAQNIDPQLVNGIIRVVFRETIQQAIAIAQVKKDVFNSVLEQTDTDLLQSIAARSAANTQILNSIVNSPDAIQKILASYGIDGGAAARKQLIAASLEDEATSKAQVQSVFAKSAQERQQLRSADYTEVAMAFLLEGLE